MHNEIGSYQAKTRLPEILRRVEAGETFTITNRGKPVADLIPNKAAGHARLANIIDTMLNNTAQPLDKTTLQALKTDGRK